MFLYTDQSQCAEGISSSLTFPPPVQRHSDNGCHTVLADRTSHPHAHEVRCKGRQDSGKTLAEFHYLMGLAAKEHIVVLYTMMYVPE